MPRWPKVRIAEVEASEVPDHEAEQSDLVVCVLESGPVYFPDDVRTVCAGCGAAIRHRPYVPKKPPKVCVLCAPGWLTATWN